MTHPVLVVALVTLLGTGEPTPPPDAPRIDVEPVQPVYVPPPEPPAVRPPKRHVSAHPAERPLVLVPTLVGVGLLVSSAVFFKLAADDGRAFQYGQLRTRSEVSETAAAGRFKQTAAGVLAAAGLAALGFAGYIAFAAPPRPTPSVGLAPSPGGAFAVVSGALP